MFTTCTPGDVGPLALARRPALFPPFLSIIAYLLPTRQYLTSSILNCQNLHKSAGFFYCLIHG